MDRNELKEREKEREREREKERGRKVLAPEEPLLASSVSTLSQIARRSNWQPLKP